MKNIINYVEKYGSVTFKEKCFGEVDNLVFSFLTYLNLESGKTLGEAGKIYLEKNNYNKIRKIGIAQKEAYKLLLKIVDSKRYKDIMLRNRIYKSSEEMQFSAVTFEISKNLSFIAFEGTDELISGWKEDFFMTSIFPIPSQVEAIKYVNKQVKIFGPNIIIGGHSKGGNLALVSSMYMRFFKKFKVKKVYNNDGPGLRKSEFNSRKFKRLKRKYEHIIPNNSVIGLILNNAQTRVIKSNKKTILCHDMSTWEIEDDKLVPSLLEDKAIEFGKNFLAFFEKHSYEELTKVTINLFKILEDEKIDDTTKLLKITNLIKVGHKFKHLDNETKNTIIELIRYMYKFNIGR